MIHCNLVVWMAFVPLINYLSVLVYALHLKCV